MKRTTTILFFLLIGTVTFGQEYSYKYGKITSDELQMDTYLPDTTANAVVLFKKGTASYDYLNNNFYIIYEYETKIKVLSTDGTDHANITIPIYNPTKSGSMKENISRIEAVAYNIENGKTIRSRLEKNYIFEERISPTYKQVKFSIPNVKAGTVFEYRYRIQSDLYYQLKDWEIQENIPVVYSLYEVEIPEYFHFTQNSKGYETINTEKTLGNKNFFINLGGAQTEQVHCSTTKLKYSTQHMPALKERNYVWCPDDYRTQLSFELHGVQFPYSTYQPFASDWSNIDKTLLEDESWGNYLKMRNPFREEVRNLSLGEMDIPGKTAAVFELVKNKIKWNGKYGLTGGGTRQAIKDGQGTNAEINFVLYSALQDAGIEAFPVLLSRRNLGRLPLSQPTINKLNTFILAVQNGENLIFLDGSTEYGSINSLAPSLMTDRARLLVPKGESRWISLVNAGRNNINSHVSAVIQSNGTVTGKRQISLQGIPSASFKKQYYESDSIEYIEDLQQKAEITITAHQLNDMDKYLPQAKESIEFSKNISATDTHIYLNPMIFSHITTNHFTEEERVLPIEFSYPYNYRHIVNLIIPEGYEIDEIPKDSKFNLEDGAMSCQYLCSQNGNKITLSYQLRFSQTLFSSTQYAALKEFWESLVHKNTEQLVLKKVN